MPKIFDNLNNIKNEIIKFIFVSAFLYITEGRALNVEHMLTKNNTIPHEQNYEIQSRNLSIILCASFLVLALGLSWAIPKCVRRYCTSPQKLENIELNNSISIGSIYGALAD